MKMTKKSRFLAFPKGAQGLVRYFFKTTWYKVGQVFRRGGHFFTKIAEFVNLIEISSKIYFGVLKTTWRLTNLTETKK